MKIEKDIAVWEGIIPPELCNSIIEHFEQMRELNTTAPRNNFAVEDTQLYHSEHYTQQHSFYLNQFTPFLNRFWQCWQEYSEYYRVLESDKPLQIRHVKTQRTDPGQGFHQWHYEADSLEHANRIAVFSLYLNTVEEGGETEFLKQGIRCPARTGDLVIWPGSYTHAHRGNPPLSGVKYILTGWVEF